MGTTLKEEDFKREVAIADENPSELNNFLRLSLNVWTNASERFLERIKWDACGTTKVVPSALRGATCFGGLDLASTTDIASLALAFPDDDGGFDVLWWFWAPEDNAARREERDKVPYLTWARQGYLTLTPGNVIDYDFIRATVNDLVEIHDHRKTLADPYNATQLVVQLQGDGIPIEFIRQGFLSLSGPTKEFERLVLSGKLRHGNNPVANWMADNAVAVRDASGNIKLSKEKSTEKIDGLAALVNAIAAATMTDGQGGGGSVYNERDMIVL
jgi:phage terminase large subunit-like protein